MLLESVIEGQNGDLCRFSQVAHYFDFHKFIPAMSDRLFALKLFARVARKGSFSSAGRDLNIPQPTVSRVISQLERDVGASLLTRTTRAVSLTEAGTLFLARVEMILAALDEAEHEVRGTGELRGVLRVGLSTSFAIRALMPVFPRFLAQHPALKIDFLLDDQRQDLVEEGVDVAIRFGPLSDTHVLAKRIGTSPRVLTAAPAYLRRAGIPKIPSDLARHSIIVGPSQLGHSWSFQKNGRITSVRVDGRMTVTVNEVSTAAAVAGLGITSASLGGCFNELSSRRLVRVLPEWDMGEVEINAVFAAGRAAKPAARAFAAFLRENIGNAGVGIAGPEETLPPLNELLSGLRRRK